jgi:hypothetical protein
MGFELGRKKASRRNSSTVRGERLSALKHFLSHCVRSLHSQVDATPGSGDLARNSKGHSNSGNAVSRPVYDPCSPDSRHKAPPRSQRRRPGTRRAFDTGKARVNPVLGQFSLITPAALLIVSLTRHRKTSFTLVCRIPISSRPDHSRSNPNACL